LRKLLGIIEKLEFKDEPDYEGIKEMLNEFKNQLMKRNVH
jgi:hypothetical protein